MAEAEQRVSSLRSLQAEITLHETTSASLLEWKAELQKKHDEIIAIHNHPLHRALHTIFPSNLSCRIIELCASYSIFDMGSDLRITVRRFQKVVTHEEEWSPLHQILFWQPRNAKMTLDSVFSISRTNKCKFYYMFHSKIVSYRNTNYVLEFESGNDNEIWQWFINTVKLYYPEYHYALTHDYVNTIIPEPPYLMNLDPVNNSMCEGWCMPAISMSHTAKRVFTLVGMLLPKPKKVKKRKISIN